METEDKESYAEEPFTAYGRYSYADYLTWELDEMVELIQGKVFRQAAAPRRKHQEIVTRVLGMLYVLLQGNACRAYTAPFDVRLPLRSLKDEDIFTVVQPDICVVCDPEKLDPAGCIGAPDLIVEILSPGNNKKELQNKYNVYEESGVKEYWIIHPEEMTLLIYSLTEGVYKASKLYTMGDVVSSNCIDGFTLDLDQVFGDLE